MLHDAERPSQQEAAADHRDDPPKDDVRSRDARYAPPRYAPPQAQPYAPLAAGPRQPQPFAPLDRPYAERPYAPQPQPLPPTSVPFVSAPAWPGADDGSGAQLIHPGVAQASSTTGYGVPVYRSPGVELPPAPHRTLSMTAMVLGLSSLVLAWMLVVVPIIGLVFGFLGLRREPAGRTLAIIGLVSSALGLLWVLLFYVLPLVGFLGAMLMTVGR
ncbi:DUF4190 domain-containing protein [Agrococcus terreus]|uniref:DUF4190 domain-containing protein n=1 Tax=Agrococcus terreus TaxID=574649 RepID=A0ABQ2KQ90_9MICO|nr:DUF4190 domain-containing protein [Agrococcus terreus]GGN88856.1 hypothetical protein GCM10010968_24880 [Agrococcus terreus]